MLVLLLPNAAQVVADSIARSLREMKAKKANISVGYRARPGSPRGETSIAVWNVGKQSLGALV